MGNTKTTCPAVLFDSLWCVHPPITRSGCGWCDWLGRQVPTDRGFPEQTDRQTCVKPVSKPLLPGFMWAAAPIIDQRESLTKSPVL